MEAVGNLAGGLAHEFNNLFLVIFGNLDLLQADLADNPAAMQKIETIFQAGLRGADLTRQLLAFSGRQPLQPTRIDINDLIGNTTRLLARTLGDRVAIDLQLGASLWPVHVDGAQLRTALTNLAINAGEAMPNGG